VSINSPQKSGPLPGYLFVISASSGAGKTTIAYHALQELKKNSIVINRIITYTTRAPRAHETHGCDYFFITEEDFKQKEKNNFFLETMSYNGALYGSPASITHDLAAGTSCLMVTDLAGVYRIKQLIPQAILFWITVPSPEILKERLIKRGTETSEKINQRLILAQQEMTRVSLDNIFNYYVCNNILEQAVAQVVSIIKDTLIKNTLKT
jgi:guanylate kinase